MIVPIERFHDLCQGIDTEPRKVTVVFHVGRCGSTLLMQCFHNIPDCKTLSENTPMFDYIREAKRGSLYHRVTSREYEDLMVSALKFQVQQFPVGSKVFIKTTANLEYYSIPVIAKHFPSFRVINCVRGGHHVAKSFYRAFSNDPLLMMVIAVARSVVVRFFANGLDEEEPIKEFIDGRNYGIFELFFLQWATNMITYQRNVGKTEVLDVFYEDLISKPEETLRKVS